MKAFRLHSIIILVLVFMLAFAGCSGNQAAGVTQQTPGVSATAEPEQETPSATAAATDEPVDKPAQTTVPAESIPDKIYDQSFTDAEKYNAFFFEETGADLDGDGQDETIKLLPGEEDKNDYQKSMTLSVNDISFQVSAEQGWHIYDDVLSLFATVLDIDENDGSKEIMISEQRDDYSDNEVNDRAVIITFADGKLNIAREWGEPIEANGTGYAVYEKYTKQLAGGFSIALQGVVKYSQETGFGDLNLDKYVTQAYTASGSYLVETVWDQNVAETPGGEKNILIKQGSKIYYGLYDPSGWIEVYNSDKKRAGWLDLNEVDIDKYIGYTIIQSCH